MIVCAARRNLKRPVQTGRRVSFLFSPQAGTINFSVEGSNNEVHQCARLIKGAFMEIMKCIAKTWTKEGRLKGNRYTRERKFPLFTMFLFLVTMKGGMLDKEPHDVGLDVSKPSQNDGNRSRRAYCLKSYRDSTSAVRIAGHSEGIISMPLTEPASISRMM